MWCIERFAEVVAEVVAAFPTAVSRGGVGHMMMVFVACVLGLRLCVLVDRVCCGVWRVLWRD